MSHIYETWQVVTYTLGLGVLAFAMGACYGLQETEEKYKVMAVAYATLLQAYVKQSKQLAMHVDRLPCYSCRTANDLCRVQEPCERYTDWVAKARRDALGKA